MLENSVKDKVIRFEIEWTEQHRVVVYPSDPDYDDYDEYEPEEDEEEEEDEEDEN